MHYPLPPTRAGAAPSYPAGRSRGWDTLGVPLFQSSVENCLHQASGTRDAPFQLHVVALPCAYRLAAMCKSGATRTVDRGGRSFTGPTETPSDPGGTYKPASGLESRAWRTPTPWTGACAGCKIEILHRVVKSLPKRYRLCQAEGVQGFASTP